MVLDFLKSKLKALIGIQFAFFMGAQQWIDDGGAQDIVVRYVGGERPRRSGRRS